MNRILLPICLLLSSCIGHNNPCDSTTGNQVCITIINQSGHRIIEISLVHERGRVELGSIPANSSISTIFESPGENSYVITAVLDHGDTLKSPGTYTEGGYKLTEIVTQQEIKTKFDRY